MKPTPFTLIFCIISPFLSYSQAITKAISEVQIKKLLKDQDGCITMADLKTGKIVLEYNSKRCQERFSPCSTFKIAAALMAFEKKS